MARKKSEPKGRRAGRAAPAVVAAAPEQVLEEVETGGAGIEEGIAFTTFFLLAGALYLIYTLLQDRYPA